MTPREEFLQKMYEQMFRDISQQISTIWQAVATVFGSFAIIALAEKGVVPIDFGITIVVILCGWFIITINECSYWYNRNLCIIANIERQFLVVTDLKDIVYYFGAHRPRNKMIFQLKVQIMLGGAILGLVTLYHLALRVWPGRDEPLGQFEPLRALPYAFLVAVAVAIWFTIKTRNSAYAEFLANSPGIAVNTSSVSYGIGHGH